MREKTLIARLGSADELIDDKKYRPMFRSRQIQHEELFNFSIELAKKKQSPSKYFAKIWGKKQLNKTISWLQKLVNQAKSEAIRLSHAAKASAYNTAVAKNVNHVGLKKLAKLKRSFNTLY